MKISIIIPTYNEEHYLPLLFDSIQRQSFKDYEIIVADAQSKDATPQIAEKFGAKVVEGGLPARGRNNGAKAAQGEFFFFFDADVILPDNFLQNAYDEMQKRYLDLATCEVLPLSDLRIDQVLHSLANLSIRMGQFTNPHAGGFCILTTKRLFERVGGFDERLTMAEDHEFVKRASRYRPLRVLESTEISVSVRRLEKEGRYVLLNKYLLVELHRIFKGELTSKVIEYEFGNFQKQSQENQKKRLAVFDRELSLFDRKLRKLMDAHKSGEGIFEPISTRKAIEKMKGQFDRTRKKILDVFDTK